MSFNELKHWNKNWVNFKNYLKVSKFEAKFILACKDKNVQRLIGEWMFTIILNKRPTTFDFVYKKKLFRLKKNFFFICIGKKKYLYKKSNYKKNNKIKTSMRPYLFTKKINTNHKLVPFNISANDVGSTKYLPPISKEWKNSVYYYNSNNSINYPVYDLNINYLIKSYFNLYFKSKFIKHKYMSRKKKRKSYNKIFVSKAEIKHTNSKAIITIYVYNREKLILKKKISELIKIFAKLMLLLINKNKIIKSLYLPWIIDNKNLIYNSSILWKLAKYKVKEDFKKVDSFLYIKMKRLAKKLYKLFVIIRRYRLRLSLNRYKFEIIFLHKLSQLISRYYGKKVEFNIVNIKSVAHNGHIFTEILTSKIKRERSSPIWSINALLSKVVLPKVNTIIERGRVEKNVNIELVVNKYKNLNVSSIIINNINKLFKDSLNNLLYNIQAKTTFALRSRRNMLGWEATNIKKSPELVFGLGLSFNREEESKRVASGEILNISSYKNYFFYYEILYLRI